MFLDKANICLKAGDGGNGCRSFRREAHVPHGGPDGGDGGNGGDIIIQSDRNLHTLLDFRYRRHYKAGRGGHGKGKNMTGRKGADCIIKVPLGTMVFDDNKKLIFDITDHGFSQILVKGGKRQTYIRKKLFFLQGKMSFL